MVPIYERVEDGMPVYEPVYERSVLEEVPYCELVLDNGRHNDFIGFEILAEEREGMPKGTLLSLL